MENVGKIPYISRGNLNYKDNQPRQRLFNLPPLFND